ncbi:hypothetical protein [Lapillicoccus sp.]|uniref:hypothetical protein n=1 Tax=Lapillicoccus sp. TaxID=1909287 RepID=UPI003983033E
MLLEVGGVRSRSLCGGFFVAGLAIMMLAAVSLFIDDSTQRLTALKGVLWLIVRLVAAVVISVFVSVAWSPAVLLAVTGLKGGRLGVVASGRIPQPGLRWGVAGWVPIVAVARDVSARPADPDLPDPGLPDHQDLILTNTTAISMDPQIGEVGWCLRPWALSWAGGSRASEEGLSGGGGPVGKDGDDGSVFLVVSGAPFGVRCPATRGLAGSLAHSPPGSRPWDGPRDRSARFRLVTLWR